MADEEQDWPAKATSMVVDQIDSLKAKTTVPAENAAKGVVLAIALLTLIPAVLVLLVIFTGQVMQRVADLFSADVGWVYLILGLVMFVVGIILLNKAHKPAPST